MSKEHTYLHQIIRSVLEKAEISVDMVQQHIVM